MLELLNRHLEKETGRLSVPDPVPESSLQDTCGEPGAESVPETDAACVPESGTAVDLQAESSKKVMLNDRWFRSFVTPREIICVCFLREENERVIAAAKPAM